VAVCAGLILVSGPGLPRWLGWWAILAGVGSVLARAVWTQDLAFLPFTVFWVWVVVVSALLVAGRLAVASVGDAAGPPSRRTSLSTASQEGATR